MNPLFFIAATVAMAGGRKKRKRKTARTAVAPPRKTMPSRRIRPSKPSRKLRKGGNGKIKQQWTSFPWSPIKVSEVAQELLDKGETDAERLTLAVAKMLYPVHPTTGMEYPWPPEGEGTERDVGALMIFNRIGLRVNTLVAADEERRADEATVHAATATAEAQAEAEEEAADAEVVDEVPGDAEPVTDDEQDESLRIGRASPLPLPEAASPLQRRRPLTLSRKRRLTRRTKVDPYAYHPEDNSVRDGVFHRVEDGDTLHGLARAVLSAMGEPTDGDVAQYVSLIVCSPANHLATVWDDDHELPGADARPWGDERPALWLPKLNETSLHAGVVTTLGFTWADGSNGITPPPGTMARGDG